MATKEVKVSIIVDDNGTMRLTEKSAKKLGGGLDKVGTDAHTADRRLKGLGQQSSNTSKNFAKMSQGISSGIVPAYAALAAQIFAISAAFLFLKNAGDLATLRQGQTAYAAGTGVALKTLTRDIQDATEAQISFSDAAQAAAIGTAAGLTSSQLTKLGGAAKDVSIVLGRDVTDSFNRLVRGVTKAEPELLDELGVVLRLKDATEKYAATLGKSADELSAFERSQAVANDVLDQTEKKYSNILKNGDSAVNQFNKFGKVFDDIINDLKEVVYAILGPIAGFLAQNPFGSILLAFPLISGFLKIIIPQFEGFAAGAAAGLNKMADKLDRVNTSLNIDLTQLGHLSGDVGAANELLSQTGGNLVKLGKNSDVAFKGMKKLGQGGTLAMSTVKANIKNAELGLKEFQNVPKHVRMEFVNSFKDMEIALTSLQGKNAVVAKTMMTQWKIWAVQFKKTVVGALSVAAAGIASFAATAAKWFIRIVSVVGLLTIALDFIPESVKKNVAAFLGFRIASDDVKNLEEKIQDLNKEYSRFIIQQREAGTNAAGVYSSSLSQLTALGNVINSLSMDEMTISLSEYNEEIKQSEERGKSWVNSMVSGLMLLDEAINNSIIIGLIPGIRQLQGGDGILKASADALDEWNNSLDDTSSAMLKHLQFQVKAQKATQIQGATVDNYIKSIENLIKKMQDKAVIEAKDVKEMLRAKSAMEELTAVTGSYLQEIKDVSQEVTSTIQKLVSQSPFGKLLDNLDNIVEKFFMMREGQKGMLDLSTLGEEILLNMSKQDAERLKLMLKQKDVIETQRNIEEIAERNKIKANLNFAKFTVGMTKRQRALLSIEKQRVDLTTDKEKKEQAIQNQILAFARENATSEANLTEDQRRRLEVAKLNVLVLENQLEVLKKQEQQVYKLVQSLKEGFETGLNTNIYDLITGDESSFKDGLLKTMKATLEAVAKELSGQITDTLIGFIPGFETAKEKENRLLEEAHKNGGVSVRASIEAAYKNAMILAKEGIAEGSSQLKQQLDLIDDAQKKRQENINATQKEAANIYLSQLSDTMRDGADYHAKVIKDAIGSTTPTPGPTSISSKPLSSGVQRYMESNFHKLSEVGNSEVPVIGKGLTDSEWDSIAKLQTIVQKVLQENKLDVPVSETAASTAKVADILSQPDPLGVKEALNYDDIFGKNKDPKGNIAINTAIDSGERKKGFFEKLFGKQMGNTKSRIVGLGGENSDTGTQEHDPSGAGRRQGGIFGPFLNSLQNLFDPNLEGGFLSGLADVFMTGIQGFGGLFKALPDLLGGLFGGGGGDGGIFSSIFGGLFGAAAGGIMPGGITGYANGGIIKRPTVGLVGEGKMNEAVVPLPDGKAIPVNLNNANNSNTNNVNVSINMDGSNSEGNPQGDGERGLNLGRVIAGAVQEELQRQKRPGGILSPYGGA